MKRGRLSVERSGLPIAELAAYCTESMPERMRGLLGRPGLKPGEGLLIRPCNAIHTGFMPYAIDAAFIGGRGEIKKCVENIAPWRMALCWRAHGVVELAAGQLAANNIQAGDTLQWLDS